VQFLRIPLLCPPRPEQFAIVRFLDHAERLIRRYIRSKKKLIALLNEQKQVIIHQAVARGLDPNIKLKPSRVEWLGEVPVHWEVKPVGVICTYISYGFTNPIPATDDGPYLLTANDIADGSIRYSTARRTTQDAFDKLLTDKSRTVCGDVLVTKDGTLGRVAGRRRQARVYQPVGRSLAGRFSTNVSAVLRDYAQGTDLPGADGFRRWGNSY
jgi:type I restriction enzyme S subunit